MSNKDEFKLNLAPVYKIWAEADRFRYQGRINSIWKSIINNDTILKEVKMVIDIRIGTEDGGKQIRISGQPIDIVNNLAGQNLDTYAAIPLMQEEPEISNVYQAGNATSSARSLSISINPSLIDPASLIQKGLFLCGYAEVSLAVDGLEWMHRHVIIRGDLSGGVSFGGRRPDGTFSTMDFEVVDPRETTSSKMPNWVMDIGRFTNLFTGSLGQVYPIIVNGYPYVPAVRLTSNSNGNNTFLISQGGSDQITLSGTYVNGEPVSPTHPNYPHNLSQGSDNYGVVYATVAFTSSMGTVWEDSDSVYCEVEKHNQDLSIIGVIRELLENYSSFGIQGLEPVLFSDAEFKIPTGLGNPKVCINGSGSSSQATSISYIESSYLESYPMVSMIWERGGYGPIVTDFRTPPITHFVSGQHPIFDRASLVQESDKASICNEFVLKYNYNAMLDQFESVRLRSPDNSGICSYSRAMFGYRTCTPIESLTIFDDSTANYVLDWMVAHQALPSYYVEYEGAPTLFFKMRRGDTIELTDEEFGWEKEHATIEKLTYRSGRTLIGLRVWYRYMDLEGSAYTIGGSPTGVPYDGQGNLGGSQSGGYQGQQGAGGGNQVQSQNIVEITAEESPYMVQTSDDVVVVNSSLPVTVVLPNVESGKSLNIKATTLTSNQSPITILPGENSTIDGEAQFVLTFSNSAITLISGSSGWLIL